MILTRRQSLITPSYAQGYARGAGEAANPGLWNGLVGAWMPSLGASGGTLFDISGRKSHGTLNGSLLATGWVPNSLYFDGVDDYVDLGVSPTGGLSAVTISMRIQPIDISAGSHIILEDGTNYNLNSVYIGLSGAKPFFEVYSNAFDQFDSSFELPIDKFSNVVFTWRTGIRVKIYVDGFLAPGSYIGGVISNPLCYGNTNLILGGRPAAPLDFEFNGNVASCTIHNRVLSDQEIQHLYADPMALVRRKARVYGFVPSAAPAGNNVPQKSYHYSRMRCA